jgi:tRNA threonylcarbamoyl adenosine modification protein YeaZ
MIVLGFDTATQATAVGLRLSDASALRCSDDPAPAGHPGHATRLLAMAGELLDRAGIGWSAVQRIAVGVGPGRFTGLRVGIATARGLAQSLDIELTGVSSLQALALGAAQREPCRAILAVIDARRDEVFVAGYASTVDFTSRRPGDGRLAEGVELPGALGASQLHEVVAELERAGAAQGEQWLAIGDGALRYETQLQRGGVQVGERDADVHKIDPLAVCELGASAAAVESAQILPDYRRAPDAALARERPPALRGAAS